MRSGFYAFYNGRGRLLRAISQSLAEQNPALVKALISPAVPLEQLDAYALSETTPLYATLQARAQDGEVAWLFYPAKRDHVETVFSQHNCTYYVEKRVYHRSRRLPGNKFRQLALPKEALLSGAPLQERFCQLIAQGAWGAVDLELDAFFKASFATFPLDPAGQLPPQVLDAVPRNCLVHPDGRYQFFDLEYERAGGCPPTYIIYSTLKCDIVSHLPKHERAERLQTLYRKFCQKFGLEPDFKGDEKIARQLKRFISYSPGRLLTNIALAFIPVRAWRRRLIWWDTTIDLRH